MAATVVTAPVTCPPRRAWRGVAHRLEPPGLHLLVAVRVRDAGGVLCARGLPDLCLEDKLLSRGGQTTAERHRRGAGLPMGPPGGAEGICLRKNALRQHWGGLEIADGLFTGAGEITHGVLCAPGDLHRGSSPARASLASGTAARRTVLTRAPGFWGMREGAPTQQSSPCFVRER